MTLSLALGNLITFIIENFWPLFLIIVILLNDSYWMAGVILISLHVISGEVGWYAYSVILLLMVFTDFFAPKAYWRYFYEKKLREHGIIERLGEEKKKESDTHLNDPDKAQR